MKKIIVIIGSILIMLFVVILFVNANNETRDSKKANTEVKKCEAAEPCAATCTLGADKKACCDPADCKMKNAK